MTLLGEVQALLDRVVAETGDIRLMGARTVDGYLVYRFALDPAWQLTPAAIVKRASGLVLPSQQGAVILQGP